MRGNQWQSVAIEKEMTGGIASCARQSVAISGNQWQSVAIVAPGGTWLHSVAISGSQWPSL